MQLVFLVVDQVVAEPSRAYYHLLPLLSAPQPPKSLPIASQLANEISLFNPMLTNAILCGLGKGSRATDWMES